MSKSLHDVGLLLIRSMVGCVMAFHGAQKLFGAFDGPGLSGFVEALNGMGMPYPWLGGPLAAGAEFFGGLLLILGLGTRLAAIPVAFTMFVAAFKVHGSAFSIQAGGMEYALTLAVVTVGLFCTGGGRFAVDSCLTGRDSRPEQAA